MPQQRQLLGSRVVNCPQARRHSPPQSSVPTGQLQVPAVQRLLPVQSPHDPPQPSSPQVLPEQFGVQTDDRFAPRRFCFFRRLRLAMALPVDASGTIANRPPMRLVSVRRREMSAVREWVRVSMREYSIGKLHYRSHRPSTQEPPPHWAPNVQDAPTERPTQAMPLAQLPEQHCASLLQAIGRLVWQHWQLSGLRAWNGGQTARQSPSHNSRSGGH
jgi:hypothetical protein